MSMYMEYGKIYSVVQWLLTQPVYSTSQKRAINAICGSFGLARARLDGTYWHRQVYTFYPTGHLPFPPPMPWTTLMPRGSDAFLQELAKPDGGVIATIPGIGQKSIRSLQQLFFETSLEYGYA